MTSRNAADTRLGQVVTPLLKANPGGSGVVARGRAAMHLLPAYCSPTQPNARSTCSQGIEDFTAMAAAGVRITVLTNSLEATDVPAVHAGYAKRRIALLRAGIAL